jgi:precorrin-6B methylase 2
MHLNPPGRVRRSSGEFIGGTVRRFQIIALAILAAAAVLPGCAGTPPADTERPVYESRAASRGGTGKFYMGREISFVLGHRGIRWLERAERVVEERPDLLIGLLDLTPDTVIADIGAGSGYMTFRLQRVVPQGTVLAVDIQQKMLDEILMKKETMGVSNIATILGSVTDPNLPEAKVDAVLMVDAYHEFSHPREMMQGIVRALVPGGRVYLIEYRAEDPEVPMAPLHKMTEAQARLEMEAVGLQFIENREGLPWQHVLVFRRGGS